MISGSVKFLYAIYKRFWFVLLVFPYVVKEVVVRIFLYVQLAHFPVDHLTELVDALALAGAQAPEPAPGSVQEPTGPARVSLEGTFAALRQGSSPGAADLVTLGRTYVGAGMLDEAAEARIDGREFASSGQP